MQTKSFIQKTHDNMFTQPSTKDFNIIKNFVKSEDIKPEDLFVYPIRLCDNCKDRDEERFSDLALNSVKNLCEGVVGIKNHEWNSENAHSRIYKAEVEEIDGIKSVIDTIVITPEAKAKDAHINLFIFLNFIKISIVPIIVENPAIKVNKKDIVILFIYIT